MKYVIFLLLAVVLTGIAPIATNAQSVQGGDNEFARLLNQMYKHRYIVRGKVYAKDTFHDKPYLLKGANVQVCSVEDSTLHVDVKTEGGGVFSTSSLLSKKNLNDNRIRVNVSYVGMQPWEQIVTPVASNDKIGKVELVELDSILLDCKPVTLEEAVIIGELKKMYLKGDTTVFNVDAYKMPEGSVLLELVRRLPGLKYGDDGLTYKGQNISEMRLNGDTFFKNDINIALKNMPNAELKTLEVYETANDSTNRLSDKHLVMDMKTKRKVMDVTFGMIEAGLADKDWDYNLNGSASFYHKGGSQMSLMGSAHNTPNTYVVEKNFNQKSLSLIYDRRFKHVSVSGDYGYIYVKREDETSTLNKTFLSENTMVENSASKSFSLVKENTGDCRFSYAIDSLTMLSSSMNIRISRGSDFNNQETATAMDETPVNSTSVLSASNNDDKSGKWNVDLNRKISTKSEIGISVETEIEKKKITEQTQQKTLFTELADSTTGYQRQTYTPTRTTSLNVSPYYRLNFGKKNVWQLSYGFDESTNKTDKTYSDIAGGMLTPIDSMSYSRHIDTQAHHLASSLHLGWDKGSLKLNADLIPSTEKITYQRKDNVNREKTFSDWLYSMGTELYLMLPNGGSIKMAYNGMKSMPPGVSLLDITDYSNPLVTSSGNSQLKGSTTHNLILHGTQGMAFSYDFAYTATVNAVTSRIKYNPTTGTQTTGMENVNGNYNIKATMGYYTYLGDITINLKTVYSFAHNISYSRSLGDTGDTRSAVNNHNAVVELNPSYSNSFCSQNLMFMYAYDYTKSLLFNNRRISYSTQLKSEFYLPWKMELTSDFNWYSRHGSNLDRSLRDEVEWNLSLSRKCMKKNRGTITVEAFDVLRQRKNVTQDYAENRWTETRCAGNTSFFLFSFAYRLSKM